MNPPISDVHGARSTRVLSFSLEKHVQTQMSDAVCQNSSIHFMSSKHNLHTIFSLGASECRQTSVQRIVIAPRAPDPPVHSQSSLFTVGRVDIHDPPAVRRDA